jgi:hypothetical protein
MFTKLLTKKKDKKELTVGLVWKDPWLILEFYQK